MRSTSVKPSVYPPLPFHFTRILALLSSVIVGIILAVLIYHLHSDGYKLPWAFLVLVVSAVLSILNFILTAITHTCYGLSPRLSLTLNTILFLLWAISLGLLSWSMAQTVLTTCNTTYWGTATGVSVCRIYKTLFTFTVAGAASYITAIALDVVVRRRQLRLGEYDPMTSDAMLAAGDVKLENRNSSRLSGVDPDTYHAPVPPVGGHRVPPAMYGPADGCHAGEARDYYDAAPGRSRSGVSRVRMSVGGYHDGYSLPSEQTRYDPGAYR